MTRNVGKHKGHAFLASVWPSNKISNVAGKTNQKAKHKKQKIKQNKKKYSCQNSLNNALFHQGSVYFTRYWDKTLRHDMCKSLHKKTGVKCEI